MGTDIHMNIEVWRDGRWEWLSKPYDPAVDMCDEPAKGRVADLLVYDDSGFPIAEERRYRLFAVLAGVRDCYGEGIVPIALPRGLPADTSLNPGVHDLGDHSMSWLTLSELLSYDWAQTDFAEDFRLKFIPALAKLADDPDKVRIVFGFDS